MSASLEKELKQFEKDLSLLLVRFMRICDEVEQARRLSPPADAAPFAAPQPPVARGHDHVRAYA